MSLVYRHMCLICIYSVYVLACQNTLLLWSYHARLGRSLLSKVKEVKEKEEEEREKGWGTKKNGRKEAMKGKWLVVPHIRNHKATPWKGHSVALGCTYTRHSRPGLRSLCFCIFKEGANYASTLKKTETTCSASKILTNDGSRELNTRTWRGTFGCTYTWSRRRTSFSSMICL